MNRLSNVYTVVGFGASFDSEQTYLKDLLPKSVKK